MSLYEFSKDGTTWTSNPNFSGLSAGPHTIFMRKASDPSCSAVSISTSLSSPTSPNVSITQNGPLSCGTGTVTLTANGANSYQWSNGSVGNSITVSTAGNYSVIGTSNGCSSTDTVSVAGNSVAIATGNFSLLVNAPASCG